MIVKIALMWISFLIGFLAGAWWKTVHMDCVSCVLKDKKENI